MIQQQRTAEADQTSENQSQVQNHSAEESDEEFRQLINAKRHRINFPPAREEDQWEFLDSRIVRQLDKLIRKSTFEHKLSTFGAIVYQICLNAFGVKQHQARTKLQQSRRQREMATLHKQKKDLKKQIQSSTEEEKRGLHELRRGLTTRHSALSKAEAARKRRSHKKKNQESFFKDPYQFARQLFQQPRSGSLSAQKEELEIHLKKTYSDLDRETPLSECAGLVWPAAPGEEFNNNPPNLDEIRTVVQKARAKSAPGSNGMPNLLYKRCPNVLRQLHKILRGAWSNRKDQ